jgi:hypothetical protein
MSNAAKFMGTNLYSLAKMWGTSASALTSIINGGGTVPAALTGAISYGTAALVYNAAYYVDRNMSVVTLDATHAVAVSSDFFGGGVVAWCLSLSGTAITVGSPVTKSGVQDVIGLSRLDSTHAILSYFNTADSNYVSAVCISLSGTTVSFGTAVRVDTEYPSYQDIVGIDSTHAIIAYRTSSVNQLRARCLSISGTTISVGSSTTVQNNTCNYISLSKMNSSSAMLVYSDVSNSSYGTARCLSLSGTTVTAGTAVVFESASADNIRVAALDSTYAIVAYRDVGNSSYNTACCLSLAGTDVSAGTPYVFYNATATIYHTITGMTSTYALVTVNYVSGATYPWKVYSLKRSGTGLTSPNNAELTSNDSEAQVITRMDDTHAVVYYNKTVANEQYAACTILS